jgi:hypothetical protein
MATKLTYAQAKTEIQDRLFAAGAKMSDRGLKVPHATLGRVRLWFKPQSIYWATGTNDLGSARSMWADVRDVEGTMKEILQIVKEHG